MMRAKTASCVTVEVRLTLGRKTMPGTREVDVVGKIRSGLGGGETFGKVNAQSHEPFRG